MFDWLKSVIKPKIQNDPWVIYRENRLSDIPSVDVDHFPRKELLTGKGLYAYRSVFLIPEQDAIRVKNALSNEFDVSGDATYFQFDATNEKGLTVHVGIRREFNGAVVELLTNSVTLLAALDGLKLHSLAPPLVFPDIDPTGLGSLQGNIEFWWFFYFLPFWTSLNEDDRASLLNNYGPAWSEFILAHAE